MILTGCVWAALLSPAVAARGLSLIETRGSGITPDFYPDSGILDLFVTEVTGQPVDFVLDGVPQFVASTVINISETSITSLELELGLVVDGLWTASQGEVSFAGTPTFDSSTTHTRMVTSSHIAIDLREAYHAGGAPSGSAFTIFDSITAVDRNVPFAFRWTFNPVGTQLPEPGSLALTAGGLIALIRRPRKVQ